MGETEKLDNCLLYTSDAADEEDSVDLGGRRLIKKKRKGELTWNIKLRSESTGDEDHKEDKRRTAEKV